MKNLLIGGALATALLFVGGCGKADEALKELESLKKEACACKDAECAAKVQEKFTTFMDKHKETKGSESQAEKAGKVAEGMMECLVKAQAGAGEAAEPAAE